jgi:hypothetical protein
LKKQKKRFETIFKYPFCVDNQAVSYIKTPKNSQKQKIVSRVDIFWGNRGKIFFYYFTKNDRTYI